MKSTKSSGAAFSNHLIALENFGHSLRRPVYLFKPTSVDDLVAAFDIAAERGLSLGLRGAGKSYGDAALNSGQMILDLTELNNIRAWDPDSGQITVEPGVTIEQLWKHTLGDGWWPPVVPGTMSPTIGGCLAANVHGKNNWVAGTLGEHVTEFEALQPDGEVLTCTPTKNAELFYAMIGGFGLLGIFTSITLQLHQIYSGDLKVRAWAEGSLEGMLRGVDGSKTADYVVGWVDCTAGYGRAGRGQIHRADYLNPDEDTAPTRTLRIDHQVLPSRVFGMLPKNILHRFLRLIDNNPMTRLRDTTKYWYSRTLSHNKTFRQSLIGFSFLLDYVPDWELGYGRDGLIQYQTFIPKSAAQDAYAEILARCQLYGLPSYLGVLKRHRPDEFLLSHAVDGFSLALDFSARKSQRQELLQLTDELDEIALEAGGRFYFAKDSTLNAEKTRRSLGEEALKTFRSLKERVDPDNRMQTDLYRRCFVE